MKRLFTLSALALSACDAQAQITLTQSSFSSWTPGVDSMLSFTGTVPAVSANFSTDLTGATYSSVYSRTYVSGTHSAFPSATYYNDIGDGMIATNNTGFSWQARAYRAVTAQGLEYFGETIDRQAIPIGAQTGSASDSIVIPAQTVSYSSSQRSLQFPATYNTSWNNNYRSTVNTLISVAAYMMSNVPFSRIRYVDESLKANGWGKLRVKRTDGSSSTLIDVLAVTSKVTNTDSLMMAGSPAPAPLLNAFNFQQGSQHKFYMVSYFRTGQVTPLLRIYYTDSTYTTPMTAEVHANKLQPSTGVTVITGGQSLTLYPNPVAGNSTVQIVLSESETGAWSCQLTDATGKVVRSLPLQFTGSRSSLDLGDNAPGSYWLSLFRNGRYEVSSPLTITQ